MASWLPTSWVVGHRHRDDRRRELGRVAHVVGGRRGDESARGDGQGGCQVTANAVNVSGPPVVGAVLARAVRTCGLATRERG
jgi:hypothetical protein